MNVNGSAYTLLASAELYNPATSAWSSAGQLNQARLGHTATLLPNGKVLVAGGGNNWGAPGLTDFRLATAELYDVRSPNTFTGSLTLPSDWLTTTATVTISGTTSGPALAAAALSNDGSTFGPWLPISAGVPISTAWNLGSDGANKPVVLRLRDSQDLTASVVTGTVNLDTTAPASSMTALAATSSTPFTLTWSGSDATSGVASYDVDARAGASGDWMPVLTGTTLTSTTYAGTHGETYYFRVRATDNAGNVEAWPADYDTSTTVDTQAPTGSLRINGGALVSTVPTVTLTLTATDSVGSVGSQRFSSDGSTWGSWQNYATTASYTLPSGDGDKTVYAQFRDGVGNVSTPTTATIRLDTAAGTSRLLSINTGALYTNSPAVTLTVGGPAGTAGMQLSNDGGFGGATWQPFDTRPAWTLAPYGSQIQTLNVYARLQAGDGSTSDSFSDSIFYDPIAPTGSVAVQQASAGQLQVSLSATDEGAGVSAMRVAPVSGFSAAGWTAYASTAQVSGDQSTEVLVQFRDGAGNESQIVCGRADGVACLAPAAYWAYLPVATRSSSGGW